MARISNKIIIKGLITLGLLGFLLYQMNLRTFVEIVSSASVPLILLAALVQAGTSLLSVGRWKIILEDFHIRIDALSLTKLTFIGHFFNLFLPSAIGGDFFRAYYLSKRGNRGMSTTLTTTLLDRSAGLAALLAIGTAAAAVHPIRIEGFSLIYLYLALISGYVLASVALFHSWMHRRLTGFLKRRHLEGIEEKLELVYRGLRQLRKNHRAIAIVFGISLVIQFLAVVIIWIAARAIGIEAPFWVFLIFIPIVNLTIMIPLTINGHGLRESVYFLLFSRIGVPVEMAVTLSLLNFVIVALASLPGGVVYSLYKRDEHIEIEGMSREMRERDREGI
ncbi:MAG: lysylphosphatidylglycerol synthase transmembrane domain-containing protein [Acidobacteriota bacterium]